MSIRTLGALGLLLVAPAFAATDINQTRPLNADGRVHIDNLKGSIVVRTWAQPQVKITGSLGKGVEKLRVEGDARSLDIEVEYPDHNEGGWNLWGRDGNKIEPTFLEVTIPQRASLEVESVSANIDVQQMAGRQLEAASVSGAIIITASSPGEADVESVSGDITLRITSNNVDVESVSGDVNLQGGLNGSVSIESVSGNLTMAAQALGRLQASTVSGDAQLQAALKPNGVIRAESLSGDVRLTMPRGTNAELSVETFSGDINSPSGQVIEEEHGPGKTLEARLGSGQGDIHIESFSGDVTLQLN